MKLTRTLKTLLPSFLVTLVLFSYWSVSRTDRSTSKFQSIKPVETVHASTTKSKPLRSTVLSSPIQEERAAILKRKCTTLQNASINEEYEQMKRRWNVIVNDKHRLLFCLVPKIASTTLRRILLVLDDKLDTLDKALAVKPIHDFSLQNLFTFRSLSLEEMKFRIENYTKVLVVREPMERLLSAYRSQFVGKKLAIINTKYHTSFTQIPTFREFVEFLLQKIKNEGEGLNLDVHWWTVTSLCKPCIINYDLVAKFETIEEDMTYIFKRLHVEKSLYIPTRFDSHYKGNKTEAMLTKYYVEIPKDHIEAIKQFYSQDYFLFGHTPPMIHSTKGKRRIRNK